MCALSFSDCCNENRRRNHPLFACLSPNTYPHYSFWERLEMENIRAISKILCHTASCCLTCQDELRKSKVLITDSEFAKALRWQLAFENSPQLNAAFLSTHLRYPTWDILCNFNRYSCWRYTKYPHHKSRSGLLSLPHKKKRSFRMSRVYLLEGNEFSAFQTNAAATFLAGSLGIPPYSILDYNDMLGWLSYITTQSSDKNRVRNHNKHAQLRKKGIRLDVVQHRGAHTLLSTVTHSQAWTLTQMHRNTNTHRSAIQIPGPNIMVWRINRPLDLVIKYPATQPTVRASKTDCRKPTHHVLITSLQKNLLNLPFELPTEIWRCGGLA